MIEGLYLGASAGCTTVMVPGWAAIGAIAAAAGSRWAYRRATEGKRA